MCAGVIDLETGLERVGSSPIALPGFAMAFSPDAAVLATAGRDPAVQLWDAATMSPWATLVGHRAEVQRVAFSRDGRTLASGGSDGVMKLWNVELGEELLTLDSSPRGFGEIAFSPDGHVLAGRTDPGGDIRHSIHLWSAGDGPISLPRSR